MDPTVAVVGAGVAGCATAHALRDAPASVTVFEREETVGGRARTRRRDDCIYETGANYLTASNDRVTELVADTLPPDGLMELDDPVWTFDETGTVAEGDGERDRRLTYEQGLDHLPHALLSEAGATLRPETRVALLDRAGDAWSIRDDEGQDRGSFDAVVLTPPAPLSADLLGCATWEHPHCRALRETIESIPFRAVVSVALHYPFEIERPYYGLVNEDREHEIGWVARESCKPGFVPDGESLLVVQMGHDYSAEHFHDDEGLLTTDVAALVADLLEDDDLLEPDWTDVRRWRYALPDEGLGKAVRETAASHDVFLAGDWVEGRARLHAAIDSGLSAGERVREHLA